jgi:hypothetical protein
MSYDDLRIEIAQIRIKLQYEEKINAMLQERIEELKAELKKASGK